MKNRSDMTIVEGTMLVPNELVTEHPLLFVRNIIERENRVIMILSEEKTPFMHNLHERCLFLFARKIGTRETCSDVAFGYMIDAAFHA